MFWGYRNPDKLFRWVVPKYISIIVMRSTIVYIQPLADHQSDVGSQNMSTLLKEILETVKILRQGILKNIRYICMCVCVLLAPGMWSVSKL